MSTEAAVETEDFDSWLYGGRIEGLCYFRCIHMFKVIMLHRRVVQ